MVDHEQLISKDEGRDNCSLKTWIFHNSPNHIVILWYKKLSVYLGYKHV